MTEPNKMQNRSAIRGRSIAEHLKSWLLLLIVLSPGWVSSVYLIFVAKPQYASEASFVVRSASGNSPTAGLATLLATFGIGQPHEHAYSVQEFMLSRDAVKQLDERIGFRRVYGQVTWDPYFEFPSLLNGRSAEHMWRFHRRMTEVIFNANTSITSIRVRAFTPDDARAMARELLVLGEQTVNTINQRLFADAIRLAALEVTRAEERVTTAQAALSEFRGRELTLDPSRGSIIVTELIGRLNAELAATRAQLSELLALSPSSPGLPNLRSRIAALVAQINEERERAVGGADGLTQQLGKYDRLNLDREFANQQLASAMQALQVARLEGQRQQLFIERVVEPGLPDYAAYPEVTRWVFTNMALNLIMFMIGWLMVVGAREHRRGLQVRQRA
ncbi:hypothetical protein [Roseococcus pinisoli]|uniref:Capsular polysaccharide transport system permease protein n=1 Tax=Roseococcus pinisoli TaxID=2835040 RepID=A0ABS5QIQ9_9PROT|nr:hypothetical protein [Roseococcus pinisoli]MBS7813388.1 hypothetical protein [Roseococcus pinisoli]